MTLKRRTARAAETLEGDKIETLKPGLRGSEVPQCDPGTPGYIQGIAERPETEEEHNARLGDAAGTAVDVGYLMGTASAPRPSWPAMPEEVLPPGPSGPTVTAAKAPELEFALKPVGGDSHSYRSGAPSGAG
jgi:hypothetical protein